MLRSSFLRQTLKWTLRSDRAVARRLESFARTEQGSFLSLRLAANQTPSARRQALYLRHAADEARHARRLKTHSEELTGERSPLLADAEDLFASRGEVGFLAFVHHAEQRGREQFECIAWELRRKNRLETASLFEELAGEERHHELYSHRLLLELAGSERAARREVARVKRWELWRGFRRVGRRFASAAYTTFVLALFPLLWFYGAWLRRRAPTKAGFQAP